jgi:hypothetical protein
MRNVTLFVVIRLPDREEMPMLSAALMLNVTFWRVTLDTSWACTPMDLAPLPTMRLSPMSALASPKARSP